MPGYECRAFRESDWPEMVRFYERCYRPRYVFTDRRFFEWNFHSPLRPDGRCGQHLALCGPEIVGIMGAIAWPLQVAGRPALGEYNVNLLVDERHRGHRLSERLLDLACSGYPYSISSGYTLRSRSLYERRGRVHGWQMRRFVKAVDPDGMRRLLQAGHEWETMPPERQRALLDLIDESAAVSGRASRRLPRIQRFGSEWDRTWERLRGRYGFTTWRGAAFLNWRYIDYPYPLYTCHADEDALVVVRVEPTLAGPVMRLVDLVCTEGADREALAFVSELAVRQGVTMIDYLAVGGPHEAAAAAAGYRELENGEAESMPLPMDFAPMRNRPRMRLLALLLDDGGPGDSQLARGDCYFVKGDGDQDRANAPAQPHA